MFTHPRRLSALVAVMCAGAVGASASLIAVASSSAAGTSAVDPAAAALVPASIKSGGTVTVAADATYAPNEFISSGTTVVGMDPDLAVALFQKLGLKVKVVNATFATIIPGLQSGKFTIGMSSFTDTLAREKVVNFVDYFTAGESFFVLSSSSTKITGLASLCGQKVAVESGTTEQMDATTQAGKCKAAGKGTVTVLPFETQSEANLAVSSGRADVGFADSPVAAYQVAQSKGRFKSVGTSIENAPYGIAVPKQDGTLDKAVLVGLQDLMKDGTYLAILKKWGVQAGAITNPKINGATS